MFITGEKEAGDFFLEETIKKINGKRINFDSQNFEEFSFFKEVKNNDLFATNKIIILDNLTNEQLKVVESKFEQIILDNSIALYIKKYSDVKNNKIIKYYKEKNNFIKFNEIKNQYGKEDQNAIDVIRQWTYNKINDYKIQIEHEALEYLIYATEHNMREILCKITMLQNLNKPIDLTIIKNIIKNNNKVTVFNLIEEFLNGSVQNYFIYLDKLLEITSNNVVFILENMLSKFKFLSFINEYYKEVKTNNPSDIIAAIESDFNQLDLKDKAVKTPHPYTIKLAIDYISNMQYDNTVKMYDYTYRLYENYRFGNLTTKETIKELKYLVLKNRAMI